MASGTTTKKKLGHLLHRPDGDLGTVAGPVRTWTAEEIAREYGNRTEELAPSEKVDPRTMPRKRRGENLRGGQNRGTFELPSPKKN